MTSWSEIQQALREQRNRTKTITVPLAGLDATFTYRQIPQAEEDRIADLIKVETPTRKRGEPTVNMNTALVKYERFKAGVVSGPDGFSVHNRADYESIPAAVRDEILDAIDQFSEMPDELVACFRGCGPGGQEHQVAGPTGAEVP